ncbi:MAG: hypothetical protein VXB01_07075 [Opitutae bacterium]
MKFKKIIKPLFVCISFLLISCGTEELENANAKLKKQVKDLETAEAQLKLKNTDLENQVADMQAQVDASASLQDQLDAANQQLDGMKAEAEIAVNIQVENDVKMGELQNQLDEANSQIETLRNQLASAATSAPVAPVPVSPATQPIPTAPVAGFPTTPTPPTPAAPIGNPLAISTTPPEPTPTSPVLIPTAPAPPAATLVTGVLSDITVSVQLAVQGNTYNLPDCEVYITEKRPDVSKWGLYLKNPDVSYNNLQQIRAGLANCVIHKKGKTDANGQVSFKELEAGNYYVSTAHSATQRGLQWSVAHQVKPGQNVLILSTNNRTP